MTVSTTGTGTVAVAPTTAELRVGVSVARDDAASAYDAAASSAARAVAVLDALGLPDRRTSDLSLRPLTEYRKERQVVVGYEASTTLTVRMPPDRVGDALRRLVGELGDDARIDSLSFVPPDDAAAVTRARAEAFARARAAAEEYAALAGRTLGELVQLGQGGGGPVGPMPRMVPVALSAQAMPVEAGTADVTVTVSATWALA